MGLASAAMQYEHQPVLLEAVLEGLAPRGEGIYVDATFGRGGHSSALLHAMGRGQLYAFDRDHQACDEGRRMLGDDPRFAITHGSFSQLHHLLEAKDLLGWVDGLLLDLGVSSPQLDEADRGFSFRREGPLDMRMDTSTGMNAADWLARAEAGEIARVLWQLGEERFARRIARAIVDERKLRPIRTTTQLAGIVRDAVPAAVGRKQRIDPATRTFQALRIHVNEELEELRRVLPGTLDILAPGGRLAVITFHSLEDRIVKRFLRDQARPAPDPLSLAEPEAPTLRLPGKPRRPEPEEIASNPRARSARLRLAERLKDETV